MDVINTVLNGTLTEEIYMRQPDGFVELGSKDLVCKLNRSLYGLKQSPRCWNLVSGEFLKFSGFTSSSVDQCLHT